MADVKKYDHSIFNHPGDEGSASQEQGKTYSSADCANEAAPMGGSHEHVHTPGSEGSSGLGNPDKLSDSNIQGYQNVPPAPLNEWLSGEDVRKTRVMPVNGDPTPGMPGAK